MTIKEVAEIAGVSSAAVSRYLNGGSLSAKKREAIRKAIEATGYRPSLAARSMRIGKVDQIGVIVPKIYSGSVTQVLEGIAETIQDKGYVTILGNAQRDDTKELEYLRLMEANHVSGVILMGTTLTPIKEDALSNFPLPLVVTGQNFPGLPCVYHDDFHAVYDLTKRIIKRGRKKLGYIGVTDKDVQAGLARRRGAEEAMRDEGMDAARLHKAIGDFDAESGYALMKQMLRRHPKIDGVICATDTIALGAAKLLHEAGRVIGKDISIAGVGDSWENDYLQIGLTTANLYYRLCGMEAAKMLLERIENRSGRYPGQSTCLDYTIIERNSI